MFEPLQYELKEGVAILRMDDGKVNALSHALIQNFNEALDRVEAEGAKALILAGRPGRFSAGFDLRVMRAGVEPLIALLSEGSELFMRLYLLPIPVIVACTGHALAGGAFLLMVGDLRVGVEGPFQIGLNEVAIGMRLPILAIELVKERIRKISQTETLLQARIYDPASAVEVGYLDRVVSVEALEEEVFRAAKELSALAGPAFTGTKALLRGPMVKRVKASFQADMDALREGR